jgi:hypothetical protein
LFLGKSSYVVVGAPKNEELMDGGGFMHEKKFCDVQLLFFLIFVQLLKSEI